MEKRILTTFLELQNIKNEWKELEKTSDEITFYDTYEYNYEWAKSYKDDTSKSLFIICIYDNNQLIALMPLVIQSIDKKIFKYNELLFMADADYKNVLIKIGSNYSKIFSMLFEVIEENYEKWDKLNFSHVSSECEMFKYILRSPKYNKYFKQYVECPIINVKKYKDYNEYKSKFKNSHVNKYRNKLLREVGYEFITVKGDNMLSEIIDVHIKEQNYLNRISNSNSRYSIFSDEKNVNFIKNLYKNYKQVITFVIKNKENNIIGYSTAYNYNRVLHFWNVGVNHEYEKYSIGRVLKLEILQYIFENKICDIVDFGCGGYHWKFEWTNEFISDYRLEIWSKNSRTKTLRFMFKIIDIRRIIKCKA